MAQASRLKHLVSFLFCLASVWLSVSTRADAQVTLNRYHPAPWNYDGFMLSRAEQPGHLTFGANLQLDYAKDPLVWLRDVNRPDAGSYDVVGEQLVVHPTIWLGLWDRLLVFMQMPLNAHVTRDNDIPDGTAEEYKNFATIGSYNLVARVNLLGGPNAIGDFGVQAGLGMPFGRWFGGVSTSFVSETTVTGQAALIGELHLHPRFRVGANLGMLFRKKTIADNLRLDDEIRLTVGAVALLYKQAETAIELHLELFGNTVMPDVFSKDSTPIEALLGAKIHFLRSWTAGLAADLGLTGGYGAPNYRLIAMLGWALQGASEDLDWDKDGIENSADECPRVPEDKRGAKPNDGCPLNDSDGDGVDDDKDQCRDRPEDVDGFEDQDGCPDVDNDGDGLVDTADKCPEQAEDRDGFDDGDGCPDPDNDGDGILDADDKCPTEAEDKDGFQDQDGCPDPDNDGDGILDAADQCPNEAESKNGVDDEDGCPDLVRFAGTQIMTLKPIHFETNSAVIKTDSESILQEMAAVITSHQEILQLSVDGHTDSTGVPAKNLKLSQDRADSVRVFLIGLGISPERLVSHGYGDTQPIADNHTAEGRIKNRRVEFNIVSAQ